MSEREVGFQLDRLRRAAPRRVAHRPVVDRVIKMMLTRRGGVRPWLSRACSASSNLRRWTGSSVLSMLVESQRSSPRRLIALGR